MSGRMIFQQIISLFLILKFLYQIFFPFFACILVKFLPYTFHFEID